MAEDATTQDQGSDTKPFLANYGMTPPPVPPPSKEESGLVDQQRAITQDQIQAIQDASKQRKAVEGRAIAPPPVPQLQNMPQQPAQRQAPDNFQAFQNPMVLLSLVGSLFTRAPLAAAFSAGAAAMEGYNKGDQQAYERERERFKDEMDAAIKQNNVELERYKTVMENSNFSQRQKEAELQAIAAGVKDQTMLGALRTGDVQLQYDLLKNRQDAQTKLTAAMEHRAQMDERLEETKRHNKELEDLRRTASSRKIDQAIINRLGSYPGMNVEDLGYIPPAQQTRLVTAFASAENIEEIAKYAKANPESIGLIADASRRMNLDAYQGLFGSSLLQKTQADQDMNIDQAAKDKGLDPSQAAKAKILGKMLTTQAFADAAAAGSRGATIYLDKAFREIYQQASSPEAFFGILEKRYEDSDRVAQHYRMGFDDRTDIDKYPFWKNKTEKFLTGGDTLPPEAVSKLKEGVITTFGNGQDWTLQGGQPKRVK